MQSKHKGYVYGFLASFFTVLMGAFVKWVDDELPIQQLLFIRFATGFLILFPMAYRRKRITITSFTPVGVGLHLLRAVLGAVTVGVLYFSIPKVQFTDFSILASMYPIGMIFFGFVFLKEKVTLTKCIAAGLAVLGVGIAVQPSMDSPFVYLVLVVLATILGALSDVVVKKLTQNFSCETIVCSFFGIAAISLAMVMPFVWVTPSSLWILVLALLVGVCGLCSQLFLTKAYEKLSAGNVGLINSSKIIFATFFGFFFWKESLFLHTIIGLGLIILSCWFINRPIKLQSTWVKITKPNSLFRALLKD